MGNRRIAVLAAAVALVPATPSAADSSDLGVRIERALDLARSGTVDPRPARMDAVRGAMGLPDEFDIAGRRVSIPPDPFLAGLQGVTAGDFEAAVGHLEVLGAAVSSVPPAGPSRADLEAALARASGRAGDAEPGLLERLRRFLDSLFQRVEEGVESGLEGGPALVVLVALVVLIGVAARRLRLGPVPDAGIRERGRPPDWRRLAEEARVEGDLAAAVAAIYRALVTGLAARGLVEDRPSLTAGEVRAAVPGGSIGQALDEATRRYERVRYGLVEPSGDDLRLLLAAEQAVEKV